MNSIFWDKYYSRSAFFEGTSSVVDLFGKNSSFDTSYFHLKEEQSIRNSLNESFLQVGKFINRAIADYAKYKAPRYKK
jgi:hypothetical protein